MSTIATGVFKTVAIKRQTGLGVPAPAGAGGSSQYIRRVKSTLDIDRTNYKSQEVLPSQQVRDMRLGVYSVKGAIDGQLVQGGYQPFFESICRQVVQAIVTSGAQTNITAASNATGGTLLSGSATWWSYGFFLGDIVKCSGWTAPATANNNHYAMITAFNGPGTLMTLATLDGVPLVAKASGDPVNTFTVGKKTWVPITGQTRDYYTIEHWFSDIAQSELFTDVVISEVAIKLPASGMATVTFTAMGLDITTGVAQYFTSPAAVASGGILASVDGILNINGANAGIVTSLDITIKGGHTAIGGVVGSNLDPDVIPGTLDVSGTFTVLFTDGTYRDAFLNETESLIAVAMTVNNTAAPGFTSFVMPRVKYTGQSKDDGTGALKMTVPFQALEQVNGGVGTSWLDTTISIQDMSFA